jgi:hypothetical protein
MGDQAQLGMSSCVVACEFPWISHNAAMMQLLQPQRSLDLAFLCGQSLYDSTFDNTMDVV